MPFQADWYVSHIVIYAYLWGQVSEEDIRHFGPTLNAMLAESDSPSVHVLIDSSAVTRLPSFPNAIKAVRLTNWGEKVGWVIMVGEQDPMVKFVSNMTRQLLKLRTRNCRTREEALDFLKYIDDTVDWSQARSEVLAHNSS